MRTLPTFLFPALTMLCLATTLRAQQNQISSTASTAVPSPVPRLIKFTGTVLDDQGRPMKSPVGVMFALYASQSGASPLWMETQNVETDAQGNYSVLLGANSASGVPAEMFSSGEARWLGVQAEHQPEQPRVLLVSVPYALKAGDAQTLGGLPPSAFLQTQSSGSAVLLPTGTNAAATATAAPLSGLLAVTTGGLTSASVPVADGASDIKNSQITDNGTTVAIGGCTPDPTTKLDVCGPASINGALQLPTTGKAVSGSTGGMNSQPFDLFSSTFNSALNGAIPQHFRWQLEPVGQNTPTPGAKVSLLYAAAPAALAETGFSIDNHGLITFAKGQTMPAVTGNETVSGNFTASGSVSGASAKFTGPVATGAETVNGNITDTGNISATGSVTGASLSLPDTTSATKGVISFGGTTFVHDFGTQNTFVGKSAGNLTTSGSGRNAAFGMSALQNNTTGAFNTASGFASLFSNTTGSSNTASGENALLFNTGGSSNTAAGQAALYRNTTGNNNTAVGVGAGLTLTPANANMTGSNNTFIGYQSGPGTATQLTNATAIGANAVVSESNALVLGGTGANAVNVGIGTSVPLSSLDVAGLQHTLIGNTGCGAAFGGIGFGAASLSDCTHYSLLGEGVHTYLNRPAGGQIAFREGNNTEMVLAPGGNLGIGTPSPAHALEVVDPSSTGLRVRTNTTGGTVASFGGNGDFQIDAPNLFGPDLPGGRLTVKESGLVGIGSNLPIALLDVEGSQASSAFGNGAAATQVLQVTGGKGGNSNGSGGGGNGASINLTAGAGGDSALGTGGGPGGTVTIQAGAGGDGSLSTTPGNGGSVSISGGAGGNRGGFSGSPGNPGNVLLAPTGGLVGVGTNTPDSLLTVNGSADKPGGGSWGTFSDGRLKTVEGAFRASLDQILQLHPIRYRYKEDNALGISDHQEHIGFVAQDVARVIPEAVSANDKGYLLVNNDPILWSMLNAIKEQQREIQRLAKEIRELRKAQQAVAHSQSPRKLAPTQLHDSGQGPSRSH